MVELITVIAIIITLVGIAVPISGNLKKKAVNSGCVNNLRTMGAGLEGYLADHNNVMPSISMGVTTINGEEEVATLETVLLEYVGGDKEVFNCPADNEQFAKTGSSYFWNPMVSAQNQRNLEFMGNDNDPASIPLISDKEAFHGEKNGTNILYADYETTEKVRFRTGN